MEDKQLSRRQFIGKSITGTLATGVGWQLGAQGAQAAADAGVSGRGKSFGKSASSIIHPLSLIRALKGHPCTAELSRRGAGLCCREERSCKGLARISARVHQWGSGMRSSPLYDSV